MTSEGRHASAGAVSVAWSSDVGPRDENQDRAVAHIGSDGSWMVAVADGMGGPPRGREAAIAAIRGLPRRISSAVELYDGFGAANDLVAALTPARLRHTMSDFHLCPAATLCAAAWTPGGGLLVGYAGDTLPVLLWHDDGDWHGRALGTPHRRPDGTIALYVGAPGIWPKAHDGRYGRMDIVTENDIGTPADRYAIVIVSDGVWEPIIKQKYPNVTLPDDPLGPTLASALNPDDRTAHTIATRIMTAARTAGLTDNATVAVACIAEQPASDVA